MAPWAIRNFNKKLQDSQVASAAPVLSDEECVPICVKSSHLDSRPAISTTLEAVHKVAPGQIKSSRIEREPRYAAQFPAPRGVGGVSGSPGSPPEPP